MVPAVSDPTLRWARGPRLGRPAPEPHQRAAAVGGLGQVEQVGPLGVVELEGMGDGVQHTGRDPGQGASLELGVVLDAHPGQGGDFAAAQARDPTVGPGGQVGLRRRELGAPRDEELPGLLAMVHAGSVRPAAWWVGCPVSTPSSRGFLTIPARGFLDRMMNTTIRHRAHRGVAVAVLAASLAGCAAEDTGDRSPQTSTAPVNRTETDPMTISIAPPEIETSGASGTTVTGTKPGAWRAFLVFAG